MPDLAWDIAETQLTQGSQKENNPKITPPLQTLVTVNHPDNSHCDTDNNIN